MRRTFLFLFAFLFIFNMKYDGYGQTDTWVPVLLYHHILTDEENTTQKINGAVLSLEEFEKQMQYLHENGFNTITLQQLQDFLYKGQALPPKSVMIHFDDGYYSNIIRAYPVLKKYNFNATLFLIAKAAVETETQVEFDPARFTFIALESMDNSKDVFEYASHTFDMHRLSEDEKTTLFAASTKEEAKADLQKSFEIVDNKKAFAYPRGQHNEVSYEVLQELGVVMAFTVKPGYTTKNDNGLALNRFVIYQNTSISQFKKIVDGNYY